MKARLSLAVAALVAVNLFSVSPASAADNAKREKKNKKAQPPLAPVKPGDPDHVPPSLFTAPKGLEVTVWAKSPLLFNPSNMDIDQHGRIWVAEGVNYRKHEGRRPEGDRIVVIEDTDGDGKADKSWTFVQETHLVCPLGVAVFDNVVVVSQPPDLIVYTDVNRNAKFDPGVDKREVLLTGFNGRNHDHSLHAVVGGPDGLWYWNQGNTGAQFTDKSGRTFRVGSPYIRGFGTNALANQPPEYAGQPSGDGNVWVSGFAARMNADGSNVEIIGHGFRNSYEQCVTSFGDVFQNDNDDPPACRTTFLMEYGFLGFCSADGKRTWRADKRPGQTTQIAEWRQEDPGTIPAGDVYGGGAPTGIAFYENGALGKESDGLLLSCETGRNTVFGYRPKADGAGYKLERFKFLTTNPEEKFGGSDFIGGGTTAKSAVESLHTQFRPSDVCVGPDGAVYVTDWFDPRTGGHSDLDDTTSGTIYRIAPKGFKSVPAKIDLATLDGQIAALKSPAANFRWVAFQALKARGAAALPAVQKLAKDSNPFIAARALWLLPHLGADGVKATEKFLAHKDERFRVAAYRSLRRTGGDVLALAQTHATDRSAAVRREVALSLRDVPFAKKQDVLVALAKNCDAQDRWMVEAIGTAAQGFEPAFFNLISEAIGARHGLSWSPAFAALAWRLHTPQAVSGFRDRALAKELSAADRKAAVVALAFTGTRDAVGAILEAAEKADGLTKAEALWWLLNRKDSEWSGYALDPELKRRKIFDPDSVELTASTMPDPAVDKAPTLAEVAALKGSPPRGAAQMSRCTMCHRVGPDGSDVGPDLTNFGRAQTHEVIIRAILEPSAEIAHGYDAEVITMKDKQRIEGLILTDKNPVVVLSAGGLTQMVPKNRIASKAPLGRSLMWTPQALGLTAQDVADIVAYLKSL
ncbi:MAG: c-type cytochrome [Verrucomicrobia bacterium]|nr:c-type cytochrome [Verrucomicrobiota bacterium]